MSTEQVPKAGEEAGSGAAAVAAAAESVVVVEEEKDKEVEKPLDVRRLKQTSKVVHEALKRQPASLGWLVAYVVARGTAELESDDVDEVRRYTRRCLATGVSSGTLCRLDGGELYVAVPPFHGRRRRARIMRHMHAGRRRRFNFFLSDDDHDVDVDVDADYDFDLPAGETWADE